MLPKYHRKILTQRTDRVFNQWFWSNGLLDGDIYEFGKSKSHKIYNENKDWIRRKRDVKLISAEDFTNE